MGIKRRSNTLPSDFSSSSFPIFIHLSFPHLSSYYIQSKPKTNQKFTYTPPPRYLPVLPCFYPSQSYHQELHRLTAHHLKPNLSLTHTALQLYLPRQPRIRHSSSSILQTFKYAFNTNPQCTLPSLPPSCHVRKITLLLPSYGTPSPICPPHHLTTNARIQRQHLGRSIFDIRQPKWRR